MPCKIASKIARQVLVFSLMVNKEMLCDRHRNMTDIVIYYSVIG